MMWQYEEQAKWCGASPGDGIGEERFDPETDSGTRGPNTSTVRSGAPAQKQRKSVRGFSVKVFQAAKIPEPTDETLHPVDRIRLAMTPEENAGGRPPVGTHSEMKNP
jgi:hypothetical protein